MTPRQLRILVVTRSYPSADDLYQYPFVHRRVLAYQAAGHDVAVFRPTGTEPRTHAFEGVTCHSGDLRSLMSLARDFRADAIAAHGLSETMWPQLAHLPDIPIRAWLHGSEIPGFFQRKAELIADASLRASAMAAMEGPRRFWADLSKVAPSRLKLVFPSRAAVEMMREDSEPHDYAILPNPIDTDLFHYAPKTAKCRLSILSIRPFDSASYANDLSVRAVLRLSERGAFDKLHFTFIGDGPLFDPTLAPIAHFHNVEIHRRFLTQSQIACEHRRHGIFLVPTRLDTQGVSRDEAMASGLVPVTNRLPVVDEFVDERCAGLARPEDADDLADQISLMIANPALFLRRSAAAAERIRQTSSHERVIPSELSLLAQGIGAESNRATS